MRTALAPAGTWCKALAVTPAVEACTADIIVLADADVICDGLKDAIDAVRDGAPWAIPHLLVRRLTKRATDDLLAGKPSAHPELVEPADRGVQAGGMVVIPRDTLLEVPLDPRFKGWGQEDSSLARALITLKGQAWRGDADLIHLWHPPAERMTRVYGSDEGKRLYRRYVGARRDPAAMRRLIDEGRRHDPRSTPEPTVHDHAA